MAERKTSVAKDVELSPREKSLLESYGVMTNHFEHARDPTISRQHIDLAREQAEQETRAERGSILDGDNGRLPQFNQESDRSGDTEDSRSGSKMVQDDKLKHDLRPSDEIAKPVDREMFDRKWYEEQQRAKEQFQDNAPDRER